MGALEAKFWERLCDALGRSDLKAKHRAYGEEARRVRGELQAIFEGQTSDYWARMLHDRDCCVTVVLTLEEAIAREQTGARKMVVETEWEGTGKFLEFAPPLKMSDFDFERDPPYSREETRTVEILSAAGYSIGQIEGFRAARLVA